MIYKTVRKQSQSEYEEKKSIFIGSISRVETEEEARSYINSVKSKYKDASHNVYAYIIGQNCGIQRYSDDGEPQGTAGIPVLEVIKKSEITDTVIVVTRYFGGTLLGAGGLCRSYSKAAAMAVKEAGVVEKVAGCRLTVTVSYDYLGIIQHKFRENNWVIHDTEYTDRVSISLLTETKNCSIIEECVREITANRYGINKSREGIYFKENDMLFQIEQ